MSENSRLAQASLSHLPYITLSTATKDGVPWNAPVYAAFDETYTFFWVSAKYARHSQNIRANHRIVIVVYDSTVPPGIGKGVYFEARAYELTDSVPGHSCWPQNGPFDANLAHLLSCNTASLCKNTTVNREREKLFKQMEGLV